MASTVAVKPELIRWAIRRSGLHFDQLAAKFPKLDKWQNGETQPTLRQLEAFAKRTMTPFGYLFLPEPPVEKLPLPDFRTVGDSPIKCPSPNLLDTVQDMERRQQWMRDYLIEQGHDELGFVGSVKENAPIDSVAARIRQTLGLESEWAERFATWQEALRKLRDSIEGIGILVSTSGVVGLNNKRKLDPEEFRGFVLSDRYAPLIFVNGADAKSAQMFTLVHELAHVWLGKGGIFNLIRMMVATDATERFCNQVAAEFLIPSWQTPCLVAGREGHRKAVSGHFAVFQGQSPCCCKASFGFGPDRQGAVFFLLSSAAGGVGSTKGEVEGKGHRRGFLFESRCPPWAAFCVRCCASCPRGASPLS